jgi:hypothetical protein
MAVLKKIVIEEISGVDRPAQKHARVVMLKRDNTEDAYIEVGDEAVTEIRKLQKNGDFADFQKHDYMQLLNSLAEELQADGESPQQAFTKALTTPAGIELFGLMKRAKGSEVKVEGDAPQDDVARHDGPASAKFHSMVVDHQRANRGLSYQQSYSRLYSDPGNFELREQIKAEHLAATLRTLTIGEAQNLEPAPPFPANARGN